MLNFSESGGIRESYFFDRLEALLNAQILKFWLFPHCPHQSQSRNSIAVAGFFIFRREKLAFLRIKIKNPIKSDSFKRDCICSSGLPRDQR